MYQYLYEFRAQSYIKLPTFHHNSPQKIKFWGKKNKKKHFGELFLHIFRKKCIVFMNFLLILHVHMI